MFKIRMFLSTVGSDWLARMSGPLTVPFTVLALWFPSAAGRTSFGILAIFAVLLTCYRTWLKEYDRAEAEKAKNSGSRITGSIWGGYIDFRNWRYVSGRYQWHTLERGCYVHIYVAHVVNRNECPAILFPDRTVVKLSVRGKLFTGRWERTASGLITFRDDRIPPKSEIVDFFDGFRSPYNPQTLEQGKPYAGFLCFVVDDFERVILDGHSSIRANAAITLEDTLDKQHVIEESVDLVIGSIQLCKEIDTRM